MKQFLIRNRLTDMYWGTKADGSEDWVPNIEQAILKKREEWDSYFLENYTMFEPRNICYYRREVNE